MSAVIFCASLRHGDGTALSFAASDLNIVAMAAVATPAAFVDGVVPVAVAAVFAEAGVIRMSPRNRVSAPPPDVAWSTASVAAVMRCAT